MQIKKKNVLSIRRRIPKGLRNLLIVMLAVLLLGMTGYGILWIGGSLVVEEDAMRLDAATMIETEDGEVIDQLYNEKRTIVQIDEVPDHVKNSFIAIEDRRFYEHAGVDLKSVVRAVYKDIIAMSKVEGASTITQQLAKNLFLYNEKTWKRKAKEVMAAIYLEQTLSKDRILELYLNEIYFGDGVYGIETAAEYFFSKPAADLTIGEGAMLAGLVKAPNGYSPINHPEKALNRRNIVLQSMNDGGMISAETRIQEQGKTLGLNLYKQEEHPWNDTYIDLVTKEAADKYQISMEELRRGGYRIVVNLDSDAQRIAYKQFQDSNYFPGNTDGAEGSFVMMEQETGKIIAAIGGRNYRLGNLNRTLVERQPGSTFKPIVVYGPAMMHENVYTPYTLIPDQQTEVNDYVVSNADNMYTNMITIYNAIMESKNTSAVWLLNEIGIDYAKGFLAEMGMDIEDDGLPIALGGLTYGVTPIQMMESYRAFVHEGKVIDSYTIDRIYNQQNELIFEANPTETEVFSPQVAWNMTKILSDTVDKGTASAGEFNKALAGKTGSTEHPHVEEQTKDAWFVGYTPEYVSALWMGYDQSDEDHYLTGGSAYPTALTKSILTEIDKLNPLSEQFIKPDNVEELPEPIELPEISEVKATYEIGGFSLIRGKLTWNGSADDRVIYRIYREQEGIDERVGEVEGTTEFYINPALFQSNLYYVVPYDPLTKLEGKRSETVKLTW
ncbi:transglycosylase domain-containing protein [Oceanobacillus salinisoli]|uniref:transglycosylase domain-containing protein n=1 Tax=Oceanobacillus salinisoli TaxID=2678611 RepID=UPI0012E28CBA|nr:PBP1A family penicillin-binding protein [Oceanobacillus salinisoli]